jgi:hypothetical protein
MPRDRYRREPSVLSLSIILFIFFLCVTAFLFLKVTVFAS